MFKEKPFLTIITVSFNSDATIEDTILSVLNQTYTDIEYILVDGASTDGTLEIIKRYQLIFAERNRQFTYIHEPDKGIYDAMNKGLHMAKGKWIGIINSDDFYELNAAALLKEYTDMHADVELTHGNLRFIANNNVHKPDLDLSKLSQTMTVCHPTVFVRRDIYTNIGYFNLNFKLCADWELILRFYKASVKFGYLDGVIANFRPGGAGSGFKLIHLKERFTIRHMYNRNLLQLMDIKDLMIFGYFKLNPGKTSF